MPKEKSNVVVPFFFLVKSLYVSFIFFSFFQVTMSQDRIVTYFHEYVMKKKYEVLALYIIVIIKVVAKCSIMVTKKKKNPPQG